ncbi:MAG TPA: ABC transporter permease [Angustibacter sp.]|nr:ABC transporter permease [Angustibacter sp.]
MRSFLALTWMELKLFAREPLTVVFVVVLPLVVLYVLNGVFGTAPPDPSVWEGLDSVDFYTSAYVALVAATAGVLSLPVHLAAYREQGVLRRFRASAVRPSVLVAAHMAVTVVAATAGTVPLVVVSRLGYDVTLPRSWPGVLAAYLLVAVSFAALGALLGFLLPTARTAQGLGVLLFFVFMMLGGAGPPREVLPPLLGHVGDAVPVTYAARLLRDPWLGRPWDVGAVAVVTGILLASLLLTGWLLGRQSART